MEPSSHANEVVHPPPRPHYINLNWGKPAPSLLPPDALLVATQKVLSQPSIWETALLYGDADGYMPLRQSISAWLHRYYGSDEDPNRICITGGASQNLMNVLALLTDPLQTKAVWMTSPCFFLACRMFEDAGFTGKLKAMEEGDEGELDLELLQRQMEEIESLSEPLEKTSCTKPELPSRKIYSHVIYVVPTFSNPSGKTMPLSSRNGLVHLARKYNALIISDDIYDCLQWTEGEADSDFKRSISLSSTDKTQNEWHPKSENSAPARLVDIDRTLPLLGSDPKGFRNTLSNGSFSKIVAPGIRTGWVDASPAICGAMASCGASHSGGCPSHYMAAVVHELMTMDDGRWLDKHIAGTLVPAYKHRRELMVVTSQRLLEPLGCKCIGITKDPRAGAGLRVGGFFIWLALPPGITSSAVAETAAKVENLIVAPGRSFTVAGAGDQPNHDDCIRLTYSFVSENDIVEGIKRLSRVVGGLLIAAEPRASQEPTV